jgi:O-antigen/teichoic acid export membrane protein
MITVRTALDTYCPVFLLKWKSRVVGSSIGYRLARGAFWSLVGSLISRGMGMLAGILVARLLGKHDFGQLGMVQSTVGVFGVFAGFGMGLTANKHVAEFKTQDPSRAGRIIGLSSLVAWTTAGVMCLALIVCAPWLARATLANPAMSPLLQVAALLLLFSGVNGAQTGALSGFEAFKTIARVNLLAGLLAFPMTLIGAWWGGVTGSVWALVVNMAVNCLLNFCALRVEAAKAGVPLSYRNCLNEWPILWRFSLPAVFGGAIAGPVAWGVSALLVNQPDGYALMGVYNAVLRIRMVPEMIVNMLLAPMLPMLSEKFGNKDTRAYRKTAYSAFMLSLLITAPFGLLQVAMPALTLLPYGPSYAGNDTVVRWLMFDLVLIGLSTPTTQILSSTNRMWFGFACSLGWALLYGILGVILVPRFGATGLAAASPISHFLAAAVALWYLYSHDHEFLGGIPLASFWFAACLLGGLVCALSLWLPWCGVLGLAVILLTACALIPQKLDKLFRV